MSWLNGRNHLKNEPVTNGPEHAEEKEDTEEEEVRKGAASIALGFTFTFFEEAIISTLNAMSDEMLELDILHWCVYKG